MDKAPNPEIFFSAIFAFLRTGILKAAIELDVFNHLPHEGRTAEEVARATGTDRRGARILLDALTAEGLLRKERGRYLLSATAEAFLVKGAPTYAGDMLRITANPQLWHAIGRLAEVVRSGKPSEAAVDVPDHEFWVEFGEASEQTSKIPAMFLASTLGLDREQPLEVLDVACGSGMYGFAVLEHVPAARLTALDWPTVLEKARLRAEQHGLDGRLTLLPGSAFDVPLPADRYDLVIASHFYHHFDQAENIELSARLIRTLKPGGRLAIHEWVADDERAQRHQALMFAVVMLASTRHGDVYTFPEYRDMLEAVGFADVFSQEVPIVGSQIIQARKPV